MLDFLLIVEHHPTLSTKHLSIAFRLDIFDLEYEVVPLFTILFNHILFNNLRTSSPLIYPVLYYNCLININKMKVSSQDNEI